MYDLFIAPLAETYFQKALIGGSIVAVVAGVVGCLVVLKRMAFLGDALSHAMIAGVAGGYLVMKLLFGAEAHAPGMLLGSLIAAIATVALISFVSRISRVKEDTAIGIMYTGIFALGVVAVSIFRHYIHIDLMHFIMGDVLGVADSDLWVSAFVAAFVLTLLILFFRHFQLATFDPVMAASIGLPVLLIDYVLTTCVSLVVVSAVSMVGVILVVGLLITPAATAYLLSDRLDRMMWLAALFGVTSVVGGLYLCVWLDSAGGGAIMLFCTLQFLVVLAVAPKYGLLARWRRMRNLVPQQVIEDILTTILRHGKTTPMAVIRQYVESGGKGIKKALLRMIQDGLITSSAGGYDLTADGEKEANKVLRAHRLWEAYLDTIGTPEEQLHPTAHHLEHISDTNTVDYLDEKLGHLDHDPHGQPIP
ncbi:metal ABC transporter permease [Desulfogranum marinum]|uniref:metal ABC transporter permease n=1 Tax=Desulfogranum marinum TaxID=453220 RepID=UPI0019633D34|nr:iron chelate uptake ABC transporter family permease subunit [Desulfogranum marinum]MBM9514908.1 metal ABC transporter permease [Desulfogranum marinum]